ncbi:hypothetical protein E3N88_43082 [Mikania micrantha]|uniref:Reverse transcriptase/retrotransposon-derived protein RNase H-like domain-containing protein n=1 Tax=Mikania micrantha TaxID=192012 RepID=A0A5N6LG21_9ASTR|nr:hypothetical protein E3N88_43082 [Mikania micrantha]
MAELQTNAKKNMEKLFNRSMAQQEQLICDWQNTNAGDRFKTTGEVAPTNAAKLPLLPTANANSIKKTANRLSSKEVEKKRSKGVFLDDDDSEEDIQAVDYPSEPYISIHAITAPIVLVKNKDGTWRMCVDYKRLNEATVKNRFPIPLIEELLDELQGASIYSNKDWQEHLQVVLQISREQKLLAKQSKCCFGGQKVEHLGHVISQWVATKQSKIEAISDWLIPSNVKQLRGFLGHAGYYRRFTRSFGVIAKPLTELLKKDAFCWNSKAEDSSNNLRLPLL